MAKDRTTREQKLANWRETRRVAEHELRQASRMFADTIVGTDANNLALKNVKAWARAHDVAEDQIAKLEDKT